MRTGWIAAAIVAALAVAAALFATGKREVQLGPNPVVVELFTSQG